MKRPKPSPNPWENVTVGLLLLAAVSCTTEPQIDVNIDKGAIRVDPPELNVELPIYVVTEQCDGGFSVVKRLNPDSGTL